MVVATHIPTPQRFGLPLHVVAPDCTIVRSFGSEDRTVDPKFSKALLRPLAQENDTSFWVARPDRYVLELWSITGRKLKELAIEREWYEPMTMDGRGYGVDRPGSIVMSLHRTRAGYLTVLLQRARSDWKQRDMHNASAEKRYFALADWLEYVEQIVEVVDTASGKLVGSTSNTTGDYLLRFLSDGRLFGTRAKEDGLQVPVFWRVAVN